MSLGWGGIGFGFLAGLLSTLSPCVLPLLPLVFGSAANAHRFGFLALAGGLVLSFVAIGLFVATIGFSIGLDGEVFRDASAVLLAAMGCVLLSEPLQHRLAFASGNLSQAGSRMMDRISPAGASGQFMLGVLLGAVWSPCVGPTLGAASMLAAQGKSLPAVATIMAAFGLGTAIPLLALGHLSRRALASWRGRLIVAGRTGRLLLGAAAILISVMILSGADRALEAALVAASPPWLTRVTTRF